MKNENEIKANIELEYEGHRFKIASKNMNNAIVRFITPCINIMGNNYYIDGKQVNKGVGVAINQVGAFATLRDASYDERQLYKRFSKNGILSQETVEFQNDQGQEKSQGIKHIINIDGNIVSVIFVSSAQNSNESTDATSISTSKLSNVATICMDNKGSFVCSAGSCEVFTESNRPEKILIIRNMDDFFRMIGKYIQPSTIIISRPSFKGHTLPLLTWLQSAEIEEATIYNSESSLYGDQLCFSRALSVVIEKNITLKKLIIIGERIGLQHLEYLAGSISMKSTLTVTLSDVTDNALLHDMIEDRRKIELKMNLVQELEFLSEDPCSITFQYIGWKKAQDEKVILKTKNKKEHLSLNS